MSSIALTVSGCWWEWVSASVLNGTAVVEPQPPADWVCFADQLKTLADKRDRLALGLREAAQGRHV
ncbi:hypothetical protein [Streptomyces sp. NPDC058268]|uniref:hypothetical protein n=1 Tax=Streptomyces sp. NPDC058268 TaxID=3346413 RepID=UPI0036ED7407